MHDVLKRAIAEERGVPVRPLALAIGVTPNTIYQAIKRGEVRALGIGRAKRIAPDEARRLLGLGTEAA